MSFHLREIVKEHVVSEMIDSEAAKYDRLYEIIMGLEWRLAREPEGGMVIPGTNPLKYLMKLSANKSLGLPSVLILYDFNDIQVRIYRIKIDDP